MSLRKSDLIQLLSLRARIDEGLAREAINVLIDAITQSLGHGTPVSISGFGRFEVRERTSPPVRLAPAFIPSAKLRAVLQLRAAVHEHRETLEADLIRRQTADRVTRRSLSQQQGEVQYLYTRHSNKRRTQIP